MVGGALAHRRRPDPARRGSGSSCHAASAALLAAYREYLAAVVDPAADQDELNRARAASRRARTDAQASVDRARAEPVRGHDQVELGQTVLAHTHRFVHAVLAVDAVREAARTGPPELGEFLAAVDEALSKGRGRRRRQYRAAIVAPAASALRSAGRAARRRPRCRRRGGDRGRLVEAADRITNSVDTLHSELRRQLGAAPALASAK